jgi:hypothetical protein
MKNLRIGITIGLKDVNESIWTNGMKLNILYLARLLKNSTNNYEVSILNTTNIDVNTGSKTFEEFGLFNIKDKYEDIDLLICMGSQVEKKYLQHFEQDPNKECFMFRHLSCVIYH